MFSLYYGVIIIGALVVADDRTNVDRLELFSTLEPTIVYVLYVILTDNLSNPWLSNQVNGISLIEEGKASYKFIVFTVLPKSS